MTDVETQASQRTVVAFVSGLLIGGLLVWVFSATPEEGKKADKSTGTDVETVEKTSSLKESEKGSEVSSDTENDAEIAVADQAAGMTIALGAATYPSNSGWVVVREYANGVSGNVLGAARYDVPEGLRPTTVELARSTVKGGTYEVLFYTNDGALTFSLTEDMPVLGTRAVFTAN